MKIYKEFIEKLSPIVGTALAVDLGHDAQFKTLCEILVSKGICSQKEIDDIGYKHIKEAAAQVLKRDPLIISK